MKRMATSNVLVVGLQGLGAEIGMSTAIKVFFCHLRLSAQQKMLFSPA